MIKLTGIARNNNHITCTAYLEDSEQGMSLSFNEKTSDFEDCVLPQGYEWCISHINHAKKYLKSLIGKNISATEKLIMWY
ncbi:hypothetical protein [Ruminococcus sp.]|uniref:hypothetical protein n=1 Tax=Ruminococcus sp. TaxID=41978 RepID=UPI0013DB04CB|nr:hypothetical protein [Ruminococcus sp.]MBP5433863.1 hypothetical protein [Ruminococcus sp.]